MIDLKLRTVSVAFFRYQQLLFENKIKLQTIKRHMLGNVG